MGFTFLCAGIVINVGRDEQTETSTTLTARDGTVWMTAPPPGVGRATQQNITSEKGGPTVQEKQN